ncbi:MAG TPA: recombinase family protein [Methyloceanibacter sp.]|nr:recombinase family protein [Methyloceanibacter sp.]
MRTVIYARYSSQNQRDASIEDQIRICRKRIEHEGWTYLHAYTDHAMSGASRLRPGYQKLLEDARAGEFDVVIAEALDRLSRDQEDVAALFKQLSFCNVRIVTLSEGEISELHVGLKGTMNALYLKDLAQKTKRGMEGRVRAGRMAGGIAYGYKVVRELDANGEPVRGKRRIDEAEAATVQRIFEAFSAGRSPRAIARDLNQEGIPGPGGRHWSDTTIRGYQARRSGILYNETYIGRIIWNKQSHVKDPTSGKRVPRLNPESEWIIEEVPHLRIVDQDLWERVQARCQSIKASAGVAKGHARKFWLNRRPRHLLSGLVRCGECGANYAAVVRDYLACGAARGKGICSNRRSIRRRSLETLILDGLKDRLMQPELVKAFIEEFHAEINRQRDRQDQERTLKQRELDQVTRKHDGLIDAIADGLRTPGLLARLEALEEQKTKLEKQLSEAPAPAPRLHPNLAELYRRKVEDLHGALADPRTHDEALDILRSLIEQVVVRPHKEGFRIELVGEIAQMVAFGNHNDAKKKSASINEAACSVKVVAGAGFKPAPTVVRDARG